MDVFSILIMGIDCASMVFMHAGEANLRKSGGVPVLGVFDGASDSHNLGLENEERCLCDRDCEVCMKFHEFKRSYQDVYEAIDGDGSHELKFVAGDFISVMEKVVEKDEFKEITNGDLEMLLLNGSKVNNFVIYNHKEKVTRFLVIFWRYVFMGVDLRLADQFCDGLEKLIDCKDNLVNEVLNIRLKYAQYIEYCECWDRLLDRYDEIKNEEKYSKNRNFKKVFSNIKGSLGYVSDYENLVENGIDLFGYINRYKLEEVYEFISTVLDFAEKGLLLLRANLELANNSKVSDQQILVFIKDLLNRIKFARKMG